MDEKYSKVLNIAISIMIAFLILTTLKILLNFIVIKVFDRKIGKFSEKAKRFNQFKRLFTGIVNALYWTFLIIVLLEILDLSSVTTALITFAGVGSLVIGLAAQDIFKDIIAGFILITEDKLGHDDFVSINGVEGVVEDIKLRNVFIRTYSGQLVAIPSGEITTIYNYARGKAKAITEVTIPFTEDIDAVKCAILRAGEALKRDDPDVLTGPVMAGVTELADSGYRVRVFVETDGMKFWGVQRELNEYVVKELKNSGIRTLVPRGIKLVGSEHDISTGRQSDHQEAASLRGKRVGGSTDRRRL